MKSSFSCIIVAGSIIWSSSLHANGRSTPWMAQTGFVENMDGQGKLSEETPYFANLAGVKVFFARSGPLFQVQGATRIRGEDEYKRRELVTMEQQFAVRFVEPHGPSRIEVHGEKPSHMITQGNVRSACFDTLTYSNVWPGIHVQYTLPREGGIKYTVILEAGSDLEQVRIDLGGAQVLVPTDEGILIASDLGVWLEHPPVTFDANGRNVRSRHILEKEVLSFSVEGYEQGDALVIDPWIQTIPPITSYSSLPAPYDSVFTDAFGTFTSTGLNNAFNRVQIDHDRFGNVYVSQIPSLFFNVVGIGSFPDFYVVGRYIHKFDPDGNLLFSVDQGYEYVMTTDISVNRNTGAIYCVREWTDLLYIDPLGLTVDTLDLELIPDTPTEINSLQYDHCQDTVLLGLGGSFATTPYFMGAASSAFNGTLAIFNEFDFSGSVVPFLPYNDNVDLTIDPYTGEYYWLFLLRNNFVDFLAERSLVKTDAQTITSQWQTDGSFMNLIELRMHSVGQVNGPGRNHFEGLTCGRQYVYGADGNQITRWDKVTGNVLATVNLAGGTAGRSEGIDADLCGNVYVGSNNQVAVYDSLLNFIQNIPLQGMPQDIHIFGDRLYVATDLELQMLELPPALAPWTLEQQPDSCNLCIGEATITFCGQASTPSGIQVEWLSTGDTTLTATGLCAGWQTVRILETRNCVVQVYVDSVEVGAQPSTVCAFNVEVPDDIICTGDCAVLVVQANSAVVPVSYAWSDGTTTTSDTLSVCPDATTTYQVVATDATGAVDTAQVTVVVIPPPLVELGNDTTLCTGEVLLLDALNPGAAFLWQDSSTLQTLLVSAAGTYAVSVDNGTCSATDSITVAYSDLAVDLGPDTALCSLNGLVLDAGAAAVSYLWQDGSTAQTFTPQDTGTYWVEVSDGSCTLVDTVLIGSGSLTLDLGADTLLCAGESLTLAGQPGPGQYLWSTGSTTNAITVAAPGTYSLTITEDLCTASDTILVEQVLVSAQFAYADTSGCSPPEVVFTDLSSSTNDAIVSWQWDFGDGGTSTQQAPTHVFAASGSYVVSLIASTASGCTATVSVPINVVLFDVPEAAFTVDPTAPIAEQVVQFLDASTGATTWSWTLGDGASSQEQNPEHAYFNAGTYTVILVVSNGDCSDTATVLLTVTEDLVFYVPNSFTPNGDGINDVFIPVFNLPEVANYELIIFNRWGELVHTSTDPLQGWNGTYQGADVQDGVYVWRISVRDPASTERRRFEGHVTLLR